MRNEHAGVVDPERQRNGEREFSARELAELAGTTVRTIHYYASEGLLPAPSGSTRAASYTTAHLARLRLIGALRDEGLSLAGIRVRLAPLTDEQALAVVVALDRHLTSGDVTPVSPLGLIDAAVSSQIAGEEEQAVPVASQAPPEIALPHAVRSQLPQMASAPQARSAELDSARDYLNRMRRRPTPDMPGPPSPAAPAPQPRPRLPTGKTESSIRPEAWYHFRVTDGIELRVREDRYYQARGRMHAVVDALRATLRRYGVLGHDPPDDQTMRRD